jgi:hypothetical protein
MHRHCTERPFRYTSDKMLADWAWRQIGGYARLPQAVVVVQRD